MTTTVVLTVLVVGVALLAGVRTSRSRPVGLDTLRGIRGWHVSDDVPIADSTIDHVVVTPAAVLAVLDHDATPVSAHDLAAAERAAQQVRNHLRAAHGAQSLVVPVVWRTGADADAHLLVDGVHLVDGGRAEAWTHLFREPRLTAATRLGVAAELERRGGSALATLSTPPAGPVPPEAAVA